MADMKIISQLLALSCACFAAPSLAQEILPQEEMAEHFSAEQLAAIELAQSRGFDLYRYDQAAWHSTDAMREDLNEEQLSAIRGWVVSEQEDGSLLTTYYGIEGESFFGIFSALLGADGISERTVLSGKSIQLSESQIAQIRAKSAASGRARDLISEGELQLCSNRPFNTVVLPVEDEAGSYWVYLLTPQTTYESVPLGGHYRFKVENGAVTERRQFMNSCFNSPLQESEDKKAAALFVTHLLDEIPTEIHAFSVYPVRVPIFVITIENNRMWEVGVREGEPIIRAFRDKVEEQ